MNDPQQIRRALTEIRRALDTHSRESLAEILAIVFKEYVVEGGQPIASGGNVLDARSDIEGLSFPELVVWLQTHSDLPELALFEVSGAEVSVRAGTGRVPLRVAPTPQPSPAAAPQPVVTAPTIVRSQPMPIAQPVAAAPANTGAVTPTPAGQPTKEEPATNESGTRFSLLEVD